MTDFGATPAGVLYLVMDYVPGRALSHLIVEQGQFSAATVRTIMMHLCRGLIHAHGRGLIHRDLKSDNILIGTDDEGGIRAHIVDFGIALMAEAYDGGGRLTTTIVVPATRPTPHVEMRSRRAPWKKWCMGAVAMATPFVLFWALLDLDGHESSTISMTRLSRCIECLRSRECRSFASRIRSPASPRHRSER